MKQYATLADTVYFWFASNDTSGSGGDGASPAADVRLAGAAADAAPVYSPTPTLLSHVNYPAGAYEVAIAATAGNGFAAGNTYAVFCTLAIDSQNPTGFIGSFDLKPVESNLIQIGDGAQSATDLKDLVDTGYDPATHKIQSDLIYIHGTALTETDGQLAAAFTKLFDVATPLLVASDVMRGTDSAALAATALTTATWTNARAGYLNELAAANLPTDVANVKIDTAAILLATGTNGVLLATTATSAQLTSDVWDEILTGATHNIATSAGRRVREIGAFAIHSGTAQAGDPHSITLAATADANDGVYNRNLIVLTDNTGVGQTRTIVDYDATTKVVVVDRDWRISPDATTAYQIVPDDTPLTVDHGVARGGTATTITIRAYASAVDDAYLCNIITIIAGAGRGQARLVGSYDGTSKVVTICGEDWVTTPDVTSVYVMMPYGTTCTSCVGDIALAQIKAALDAATVTDLKQHDNKITGLISMDDDLDLSPETWLMFNANNDLIQIRKFGDHRSQFDLEIKDAAITDRVVDDTKTIKYSGWVKSWRPGV